MANEVVGKDKLGVHLEKAVTRLQVPEGRVKKSGSGEADPRLHSRHSPLPSHPKRSQRPLGSFLK